PSLGGLLIWTLDPGAVHSSLIAAVVIAEGAVVGGLYVFLPWERMHRRAVLVLLVVVGVPSIALAAFNTGGMSSPYTYFFVFIPFTAALISTRLELGLAVVTCGLGAAAPLLYDGAPTPDVVLLLFLLATSTGAG